MPYYPDSETLESVLKETFRRMLSDPAPLEDLQRSRLLFLLDITDPHAEVTVNGRSDPPSFKFGRSYSRPDLVIHTSMDVLHDVLLRKMRMRDAYFGGSLKVDGSIFQARRMEGLFHHLRAVYPLVLQDLDMPPESLPNDDSQ